MHCPVPMDIIEKTTCCIKGFPCQKPEWEPRGKIIYAFSDKLLQIDSDEYERRVCKYFVSFGSGHYCTCPTRMEIFNRYKV